jgi:hypothetical protein
VYWTKFECISGKIRRILINFARAERVVALTQIVRSDSVVKRIRASHARYRSQSKTKNFLTIPSSAGGVGGAGKKWKGKFLVLDSPLHKIIVLHTCIIT